MRKPTEKEVANGKADALAAQVRVKDAALRGVMGKIAHHKSFGSGGWTCFSNCAACAVVAALAQPPAAPLAQG